MKLKFKQQAYQTHAVRPVVDCFAGQQKSVGFKCAVDPGRAAAGRSLDLAGFEADALRRGARAFGCLRRVVPR